MSYNPLNSGSNSKGTARATSSGFINASGTTLTIGQPVSSNGTSSQMIPLDPSSEASVDAFLGLCASATPSAALGQVYGSGRVQNVLTSFSVGDVVYAGKATPLINVKPDIGVAGFASGDFVIFIGVLVKNEFDNSKIDIQLLIEKVGQL